MSAFDPIRAAQEYATLDTEDVVRIAYLEPDYLPEAKALAASELVRRGIPKDRQKLIRQVRAEIRERHERAEIAEHERSRRSLDFRWKLGLTFMLPVFWAGAAFAPMMVEDWSQLASSNVAIVMIAWIVTVFDSVRQAKKGAKTQLYLAVIVPVLLAMTSLVLRVLRDI